MADMKDKATYGLIGAVTAGMINLGIFAMKSDVSDLRAEMYREFVTRKEWSERVQVVDRKLDSIQNILLDMNRRQVLRETDR